MVVLTDNDGAPIAEIDNGAETACDLSAQEVFAKPEYVGLFNVSIRALSDDPEVFSNSEAQSANSHFASGAGTQGDPFIIDRDGYLRNISTANAKAAGRYYKLTYTPAPGADFEPICSPAAPLRASSTATGRPSKDGKSVRWPTSATTSGSSEPWPKAPKWRRSTSAAARSTSHQRRRFGQ
ncbi:MAG: hypothetical protein ACLSCF_07745 [Alistipes finegoldii]